MGKKTKNAKPRTLQTSRESTVADYAVVDKVRLDIDYHIIEHFSKHLYESANKAVEELVSNGFDAFAYDVRVYVPGPQVSECVAVWDNGNSMDVAGLKDLWLIASSPKNAVGVDRMARGPKGKQRAMIGKFGIGKLASYSVGNSIAHLCRNGGEFLLVSVAYDELTRVERQKRIAGDPVEEPIYRLTESQAREFIFKRLKVSQVAKEFFDQSHWTFAAVERLKTITRPKDLSPGQLRWVLGNGMPLRPDFRVWVNDLEVVPSIARAGVAETWDFASLAIQKALLGHWKTAKKKKQVTGGIVFGSEKGLDPKRAKSPVAYVEFPTLGRVYGSVRLYTESLEGTRAAEEGRSSGFFVFVRGRLINPTDDKLFLHDPSFGTFYRSQFELYADGLDQDLLADRARLREDTDRGKELGLLQRALYLVARNEQDSRDAALPPDGTKDDRLPTQSREFFRRPLTTLFAKTAPEALLKIRVSEPNIQREALGPDERLAVVSEDGTAIVINVDHPYYMSIATAFGHSAKAVEIVRRFEAIAVAELTLEGRLYELGIDANKTKQIMSWRDGVFREMAKSSRSLATLADNLEEASYRGDKLFENALADVLNAMGFIATPDGASGKKDICMLAPCGKDSFTISFEAKGVNNGKLSIDAAEVGGANSHRIEAHADHAVIVGRGFAGFERLRTSAEPEILKQCRAAGTVSIMDTACVRELLYAIRRLGCPLNLVRDIFTAVEYPAAKFARIKALSHDIDNFDWQGFLEETRRRLAGKGMHESVSYYDIRQSNPEWKSLDEDKFKIRLMALEAFVPDLISLDTDRDRITLLQAPDVIVARVEQAIHKPPRYSGSDRAHQ